jgi:hypothetical protein
MSEDDVKLYNKLWPLYETAKALVTTDKHNDLTLLTNFIASLLKSTSVPKEKVLHAPMGRRRGGGGCQGKGCLNVA